MNAKNVSITLAITFVVIIGLYSLSKISIAPSANADELGTFATCITDSGAKFYGAFWCSHCQNQKKAFGDAADKLPYIECSTQDNKQTTFCTDAKIEGYPTWEFKDGSRLSGELPFLTLAEKTGCTPPAITE